MPSRDACVLSDKVCEDRETGTPRLTEVHDSTANWPGQDWSQQWFAVLEP